MGRYKRITLYFKMDDNQDSLRYALIGSLGKGKKTIFDNMIDQYLQSYGISNLGDLTLKDLQLIKKELMGVPEEKEKRGRGRPRKTQVDFGLQEEKSQPRHKDIAKEDAEDIIKQVPKMEEKQEGQRIEGINEVQEDFRIDQETKNVKSKNPMAINIDEDTDGSEETVIDQALLGELDAFF